MENSLFESGKLLSKHLTFMVSTLILLLLLIINVDGKDVVKIPVLSYELDRTNAISIVVLFYYLTLWKFFSCMFYQFKLAFNFTEHSKRSDKKQSVYLYLYPSSFNYLLFHHHMNDEQPIAINKVFVIYGALILVGVPFWCTLYLIYISISGFMTNGVNISGVIFLIVSLLVWPITSWLKAHLKWLSLEVKKNKHNKSLKQDK